MAASVSIARQQLQKIAAKWPGDPFRPEVQLKTFLTSLADHPRLSPEIVSAARALQNDEFKHKVSLVLLIASSWGQIRERTVRDTRHQLPTISGLYPCSLHKTHAPCVTE